MKPKRRKKGAGLWIIPALAVILAAGGWLFFARYALYRGQILPRDVAELDLRGQEITAEELAKAEETFTQAHILRSISIGGQTWSSDAEEISVGNFTREEIGRFGEFEALKKVNADGCADVETILALREAMPQLEVTWTVPLGGPKFSGDDREIRVEDASAQEIADALERLPFAESVTLTASGLTPEEQLSLTERFPAVSFGWDVLLAGRRIAPGTEVLDLEDAAVTEETLSEIDQVLPLLDAAAELRLGDPEADDGAVRAFADRHPELAVAWRTALFGVEFSTEDTELIFDDIPLTTEDAAQIEAMVPYMHALERVSMQRCGIGNDDMEAIYKRHIGGDGVKFVWMVQVTNRGVPTDQTFYQSYQWTNPDVDYYYNTSNQTFEQLRYCHDMIAIDLGHK